MDKCLSGTLIPILLDTFPKVGFLDHMVEDEMAGWHHRLSGHELGQTLGDSEGPRGLACCSPWGDEESDTDLTTEKTALIHY